MSNQERLAVFVPANTTASIAFNAIKGSAIVGRPGNDDENITVYYEGNLNKYRNIKTYADRASLAVDRLTEHYPTIARAFVPMRELRQVGWFDPNYGITLMDEVQAREALASWLGVEVIEEKELRFSSL